MNADLINAGFETLGGFAILLSVWKLHQEKIVRGVSWPQIAFFTLWGLWNLAFYPLLGQWLSFLGGAFLVVANTLWLIQIFHYSRKETAPCPYSKDFKDPQPISL